MLPKGRCQKQAEGEGPFFARISAAHESPLHFWWHFGWIGCKILPASLVREGAKNRLRGAQWANSGVQGTLTHNFRFKYIKNYLENKKSKYIKIFNLFFFLNFHGKKNSKNFQKKCFLIFFEKFFS